LCCYDGAWFGAVYTGMVRTKNSLSTVMQSFTIFCVIAVLWVVYGYSVAFTAGNPSSAAWTNCSWAAKTV